MTTPITLPYLGAAQAAAADLVSRGYVSERLTHNIAQSQVDALIASGLAPYATKSYVDAQDALNADKAFIDAGDAPKLKLIQKEVLNAGIVGLSGSGRVAVSHVNVASTQRFPKPYLSPAAYNTGSFTATSVEVRIYPAVTVADPGFAYKLLVTGLVDANTSNDGDFPVIRVRQGTSTGPVVATGAGCAQTYTGGVLTPYTATGGQPYNIPSWAATLDVILVGGGGGGAGGNAFIADGVGGAAGHVATATLRRGTDIPGGTNTLTINVGTAGGSGAANNAPGGAGTATTAVGAGWAGLTAAGGAGGSGTNPFLGGLYVGAGPGSIGFNGHAYPGGASQGTLGAPGNPPGGGGGGGDGQFLASLPGGAGADGGAWVLAYPNPNVPYGPVPIVPSALNVQGVLTGATTLHVMLVRSGGTATVTATALRPNLMIVPIPA